MWGKGFRSVHHQRHRPSSWPSADLAAAEKKSHRMRPKVVHLVWHPVCLSQEFQPDAIRQSNTQKMKVVTVPGCIFLVTGTVRYTVSGYGCSVSLQSWLICEHQQSPAGSDKRLCPVQHPVSNYGHPDVLRQPRERSRGRSCSHRTSPTSGTLT